MSTEEPWCYQNKSTGIIYYDYILVPISALTLLLMIPFIFKFIYAYITGEMKIASLSFYIATAYFILIIIIYIIWIPMLLMYCHDVDNVYQITTNIVSQIYVLQGVMISGQFYYRLQAIFKRDRKMALSKAINSVFWSLCTLTAIVCISGAFLYSNYHSISSLTSALTGILLISLMTFVVSLFTRKLFIVYKTSKDEDLTMLITKTLLLTFISTLVTFVVFVIIVLVPKMGSLHWTFIRNILVNADLYTNFLCIILSYSHFDKYYQRLCGICGANCHRLWIKWSEKEDLKMMEKEVESADLHSQINVNQ